MMISSLPFIFLMECLFVAARPPTYGGGTIAARRIGLYATSNNLHLMCFQRRKRHIIKLSSVNDDEAALINDRVSDADDPNAIFARLLESQLQIVVSSTSSSVDYAAIYIDAGDSSNNAAMQLISSYPPVEETDDEIELSEIELSSESRYAISYRGSAMGVLQLRHRDTKPADTCPVAEAVAESIGMSIAMEMARQSLLEEFRDAIQSIRAIESDAWLRSSSALLTSRTLLKMVGNRLPQDDDIGREMVENVLVQAESIGQALSLLSHDADEEDEEDEEEEGRQGGEAYYAAVGDDTASSSGAVIDVSVIGNSGSGGGDTTHDVNQDTGGDSFPRPNAARVDQDNARRRAPRDSSARSRSSSSNSRTDDGSSDSSGRGTSKATLSDDFWTVQKEETEVDYNRGDSDHPMNEKD